MNQGLFITGTGTEVGKTVVTAGTVRWLRKQGIDAVPAKPVQTGGQLSHQGLVAPDLIFSLSTSNLQPSREEIELMSPYVYELACSPHLAGRRTQHYPELSHIQDCAEKLLTRHKIVVMEGTGGVMTPLNETTTMLDLMKALDYLVVLVAHIGLGTINHTLLSLQALGAAGLRVLGVVFNKVEVPSDENRFIEEDNPEIIARLGDTRVLGNIRYLTGLGSKAADSWNQFENDMPGLPSILEGVGRG